MTAIWLEQALGFQSAGGAYRSFPGRAHPFTDVTDRPVQTIDRTVIKLAGIDEPRKRPQMDKLPFRLPSMVDAVAAAGSNGYTMVGTFSGGGGSSIGYKLAGFDIRWVNEFDVVASDIYRLNFPDAQIDTRSITEIGASEIMAATGLAVGELDLLEGSPPCSKFSMAGQREKGWNKITRADSDIEQANVEDLFFEWVRLAKELQPKTLCAENVVGLRTGTAKGYFKNIVQAIRDAGYRVHVYELDASWLGVPQARRRLFFTGVRKDLPVDRIEPPTPHPHRYTILDALPHLGDTATWHAWYGPKYIHPTIKAARSPAPTIMALGAGSVNASQIVLANAGTPDGTDPEPPNGPVHDPRAWDGSPRRITIPELQRLCSFPDDYKQTGTYTAQWGRLGNAVPPLMAYAIGNQIKAALDQT
jgi:DNA (cytosine-5)-methyltransferase 1